MTDEREKLVKRVETAIREASFSGGMLSMAYASIAECEKDRMKLEAEATAIENALSPKAGQRVLAVVEKARIVLAALINEHGEPTGVVRDLAEALAALGGEHD